jgi:predicted DNA binding CopG/RHH family protein
MKPKLTTHEKEILESVDRGEWKSLGKKETRRYRVMARHQLKNKRINIRLGKETLERLRHDADNRGLPYQTFISSVLYQYAHGRLKDEQAIREALQVLR